MLNCDINNQLFLLPKYSVRKGILKFSITGAQRNFKLYVIVEKKNKPIRVLDIPD